MILAVSIDTCGLADVMVKLYNRVQSMIARVGFMASITIRRLDDELKEKLRVRAARHGRSMEDEVRELLRTTLSADESAPHKLATAIGRRFGEIGGVELNIPEREAVRKPPEVG